MLLASTFMGHDLNFKVVGIVAVVFVVLVLFAKVGGLNSNRGGGSSSGGSGEAEGHGRKYQCQRCGTWFQPEKTQDMGNGQTRRWVDERCPHCGWDKDFRDHDHDGRPDQYE